MKIWTVANQKGGVGKTTTVASLAGSLAKRGLKVLMIDTDPHASLGYYLGIDSELVKCSLYDLFLANQQLTKDLVKQHIVSTAVDGIDLIPSTMALATLDRSLGHQGGMGLILKKILLSVDDSYDIALIDCPPVLGVLMVNALAASQHIIVPVQTEFLAIKGLDRMIKTMILMGRSKRIQYSFTIVPTMYDRRTKASAAALQQLSKDYGEKLWPDVIPVDTKFRDASLAHLPASHFAATTRGVKAYERLLDHLLEGAESHVQLS